MLELKKIHCGDSLTLMRDIDSDSVDCIVTDPPYGMRFMGKHWDKAVPSVDVWKECLRILKPGAFAFVICIPRQDCLAHMIVNLGDAGFNVAFSSIYWTYASGFLKAQNLSKAVDKRAGEKREAIGKYQRPDGTPRNYENWNGKHMGAGGVYADRDMVKSTEITAPATPQAKALDGAYSGFQPKPAVEVIIVAMKPLSEKTYIDQAMSNMHGCTWLDDCMIPYESEKDIWKAKDRKTGWIQASGRSAEGEGNIKGRFPANVLCEDNVLEDRRITKSTGGTGVRKETNTFKGTEGHKHFNCGDSGSFSRYFSLDAWFAERIKQLPKEAQKTFPWLIVPKASKSEKNRGLDTLPDKEIFTKGHGNKEDDDVTKRFRTITKNSHATVKPIKLMSWLITLASREGDTVLDPFVGSGTTCIAAKMLGRQYLGIDSEEEYIVIARKRLGAIPTNLSMF